MQRVAHNEKEQHIAASTDHGKADHKCLSTGTISTSLRKKRTIGEGDSYSNVSTVARAHTEMSDEIELVYEDRKHNQHDNAPVWSSLQANISLGTTRRHSHHADDTCQEEVASLPIEILLHTTTDTRTESITGDNFHYM